MFGTLSASKGIFTVAFSKLFSTSIFTGLDTNPGIPSIVSPEGDSYTSLNTVSSDISSIEIVFEISPSASISKETSVSLLSNC